VFVIGQCEENIGLFTWHVTHVTWMLVGKNLAPRDYNLLMSLATVIFTNSGIRELGSNTMHVPQLQLVGGGTCRTFPSMEDFTVIFRGGFPPEIATLNVVIKSRSRHPAGLKKVPASGGVCNRCNVPLWGVISVDAPNGLNYCRWCRHDLANVEIVQTRNGAYQECDWMGARDLLDTTVTKVVWAKRGRSGLVAVVLESPCRKPLIAMFTLPDYIGAKNVHPSIIFRGLVHMREADFVFLPHASLLGD
jgi:hypothetical protein